MKHIIDYSKITRSKKYTVNEFKLQNNLIRGKNMVTELALCNDWQYFVTLTIDGEKYDRENLKVYFKNLGQFIRDQRKKYKVDISYLLVPELHADEKSWHMHGLITGFIPSMLSPTGNKDYMTWTDYQNKFGYMSMSEVENAIGVGFYIRKYITKTFENSPLSVGCHTYYCSRGLKRADRIWLNQHSMLPINNQVWKQVYDDDFCRLFDIEPKMAEYLKKYKMDISDKNNSALVQI